MLRALLLFAVPVLTPALLGSPARELQALTQDRATERDRMVAEQLQSRDITDRRVLDAMRTIPRHEFVPAEQRTDAYRDSPLPIGYEQTISQPYIVAFMSQGLRVDPTHKVLEIGTGWDIRPPS